MSDPIVSNVHRGRYTVRCPGCGEFMAEVPATAKALGEIVVPPDPAPPVCTHEKLAASEILAIAQARYEGIHPLDHPQLREAFTAGYLLGQEHAR